MSRPRRSTITAISRDQADTGFLPAKLVKKIGLLVAFVAASRVGVYDRLPGVDVAKFSEAVSNNGVLGYIDNITGGSISNVGVFSLGIIPAINASIFLQVLTIAFPSLKKMAREDGPQGKARYQLYQKLATLGFATAQAYGQLNALRCALVSSACCRSPASAIDKIRSLLPITVKAARSLILSFPGTCVHWLAEIGAFVAGPMRQTPRPSGCSATCSPSSRAP